MGKKLEALLGRNFKASKFKTLAKLAISRGAILKSQRKSRYHHAQSDVLELLKLGLQDRALVRVEHVIKERNMVDVFVMVEEYCHLISERVALIQKDEECPQELREAISSLIFASSRCGEFPELLEIRAIFVSRFGKEFAAGAIELRNNCGVNPKIIQKLLARRLSLESRLNVLKEIATENGIILHFEEETPVVPEGKLQVSQNQKQLQSNISSELADREPREKPNVLPEGINLLSESFKLRKKYRDVATAPLEAFESAAYVGAAARAAVELSTSKSQDDERDNSSGSSPGQGTVQDSKGLLGTQHVLGNYEALEEVNHLNVRLLFHKIYPTESVDSDSEGEDMAENQSRIHRKEAEGIQKKPGTMSTSSSDSESNRPSEINLVNSLSRTEAGRMGDTEQGNIPLQKRHDMNYNGEPTVPTNGKIINPFSAVPEEDWLNRNEKNRLPFQSPRWHSRKSHDNAAGNPIYGEVNSAVDFGKQLNLQHLKLDSKPMSVRTRRVRGN